MTFRVARHTKNLQLIIDFYCNIPGFEILGRFENHYNYDGVFIGKPNSDWHLEFTVSDELPKHEPDEDDLLVFYPENENEFEQICTKFESNNIKSITSKNPYWNANGVTYIDPDGFRIVIAKK
ncbi:hypothetical protein FNO01nite_25280 [Flavobacterium noncentrifugens]|uniref:VOC domain-containing protein n=1 Tax=Flavobacterium noncentrifugens TaxID=1128970 RepID=A0A1G8ZUD7_9FLAO|nr:VOC family protein [Flavobacterium noncentrifugens]GEP51856.1 hypothetical protein FNO01nite_25280 [Flavobacterium noncentrifugens]SDK17750.1 hypothetical protein SAMN04487935_2714 [Flavobacterium noncentrifugens]